MIYYSGTGTLAAIMYIYIYKCSHNPPHPPKVYNMASPLKTEQLLSKFICEYDVKIIVRKFWDLYQSEVKKSPFITF